MEKTRPAFENAILDSVLSDFDDVPPSESIGHEFSPEFELKAQKLIKKSGSNAWHCVNTAAKKAADSGNNRGSAHRNGSRRPGAERGAY